MLVIEQKINLRENILYLAEVLKTDLAIQDVCNRYLTELTKSSSVVLVESFLNSIKNYDYIPQVQKFIDFNNKVLNENYFSFMTAKLANHFNSSSEGFYRPLAEKLNNVLLIASTEDEMKEQLKYNFSEWTFASDVLTRLVKEASYVDNQVTGLNQHVTSKRKFSPILKINENSFVFHLSGQNYLLDSENQKLSVYEGQTSKSFWNSVQALKKCDMNDDSIVYAADNKNIIFKKNNGKTSMFINNLQVNESDIYNTLVYSKAFDLLENQKVSEVIALYESLNNGTIQLLDMVQNLSDNINEGYECNIITIDGKNYVNYVNEGSNESYLETYKEPTQLIESVKSYIGVDLSTQTAYFNQEYKNRISLLESRKVGIVDKLNFLNEKLSQLESFEYATEPAILEAIKLVKTDIKNSKQELEDVCNEI